jgi:hypothetical protein
MTDPAVATFFIVGGLLVGAFVWAKLVPDDVGRRLRRPRTVVGLQGRQTEWLYSEAALDRPDPDQLGSNAAGLLARPGLRALQAVVRREAIQRNLTVQLAHQRLVQQTKSELGRAFLEGRMSRAIRIHWRSRYNGPPSLFLAWFYLVAVIRYGRRHLYLDTLAAALKELRNP